MLNLNRVSSALVVFGLAACGSDHSEVPPGGDGGGADAGGGGGDGGAGDSLELNKSGTRIKMRVLTSPDGAKQFQGWQDTSRNEACAFSRASDGTTRCLPFESALEWQGAFLHFADSSCTIPLLYLSTCNAQNAYVMLRTFDTCGAEVYGPLYRMGPVYTGAAYYSFNGGCFQSSAPEPDEEFRSLGVEVPLSEFQSATEAVE